MVLALADGASCVSDLAALRDQSRLFGPVASHPTAWRSFDRLGPVELRGLDRAVAAARETAWRAVPGTGPETLVIDLDATLVTCRTDKQDAAPTWKRTYGHHPLLAMDAERGEVLACLLRPGNAGSNTAADHVIVLGAAVDALPAREQAGHRPGDPAATIVEILARADAGGASHWLAEECRDRNITYSLGFFIAGRVRDARLHTQEEHWAPAVEPGGRRRRGAYVTEVTALVDLAAWPDGTRLVVRRERPHPGAQLSLFDDLEGWRHTAFITDQTGEIAQLELRHRQRGRAESVIRDVKACGMANLPFDCAVNNDIWCRLAAAALNLLAWARRLTLTGPLSRATPKTLRYRLLHIAGRATPTSTRLDLDATWPWTTTLLRALNRLDTLLPPHTVTNHNPRRTAA
jgi:hypothetical protein